jgi:ATP-dependent helicase/nuclease subunit B
MRQNLFTIAPDAPFLTTLAAAIDDGTLLSGWPRRGPFWLTDVTILLPTRRARLALAEAFLRLGHGLLPDIRTIGGEDAEAEPFLPPIDLPAPLPAAAPAERRLTLARLIDQWTRSGGADAGFAAPPSAAETFWLADSLAALLDDLTIERVAPAALRAVPPENLARNWQQALGFLDIALQAWPAMLAADGKADAATLGNERLARQASTAAQRYGDRPVIVAGSTGSQPATADLLQAIAALPRGVLVLPGLDTGLDASALTALGDPARAPHAHPQYGLVHLLRRLGARPDAVTELGASPRPPRTMVLRRALALADATAGWAAEREALAPQLEAALAGLAVLAAPGEDLEARAIAIAARDTLAQHQTVGIVSPDRNLARRIAAELRRFDVEVDDAAGTPLFHSAAGRLVRTALDVATARFAPVPLMALLRNRATLLGRKRAETSRLADLVELCLLRGQRPAIGIAGLRQALAANLDGKQKYVPRLWENEAVEVGDLLDRLESALLPLCQLLAAPLLGAPGFAEALRAALAALTAPPPGEAEAVLPGRDELLAWATALAPVSVGPQFPPQGLDAVLAALMAGSEVRPSRPGRTDIAIWGRLEARLQQADLMILAGLNEDVWPEPADPGPWLSRGMRLAAGLEPPERRQGQAAHDFEMAAAGPAVLLAFATRRGTSPALPSPLLQRLEAFIGEDFAKALRARGGRWLDAARRLDLVTEPKPATRPVPRPPASLRPRKLSVTEIETLFRSPYDIYARHVLRLQPLDPLGEAPGARERGSMIHAVFAAFVEAGGDPAAPDALPELDRLARQAFAGLDAIGERRDIWLRRFSRAAELFLDFEQGRQAGLLKRHAEIEGSWEFPALEGFRLTGRADRIDLRRDGAVEIIDFKTGGVPAPKDMKAFEAPQLLLEAAMAGAGAFPGLAAAPAAALTYIKVGLGPEAFAPRPFALAEGYDLARAADEAVRRMQGHVREFLLSDRLPMPARLRPAVTLWRGTYDHLARTDEWTLAAASEEEF